MKARLAISLASASLWHRRKVLALVCLTLTLSVTLLLGIQYLRTEVKQSFTSTISDTDLIIGARSGQLNLLLYTVFHIGDATNNIRWSTFQDLKEDSRIDWLIPISLGDSYKGFRVVGTDQGFGKHFRFGRGQPLTLASGQWFDGVFDVVLGAGVAKQLNHALDDKIILSHGGGRTSFSNHTNTPFTVTGILDATGTPVDQAVYISLQGMEAIHVGWESGIAIPGRTLTPEQAEGRDFTPGNITAVFAGLDRKILTFRVQRDLNQYSGEPLSAVLPGVALSELWRLMSQFERALFAITGFVVITSLIGLVAVLLTLQTQRAHEIAILRATGASPGLIASLYLIECLALAVVACLAALAFSALAVSMLGPWLLTNYGIQIPLRALNLDEWALLISVPLAAVVVALIPAFSAWRQSRSQGLGSGAE
ncbi:ABC transporter permease [Marinobacter sp. 2_MG-2023]|uniref:ABC transporter permease n=1 Tax=Marinobacter sp. 2_MG-2023 TaxID=3062679 RepID=UPI0026E46B0C|nr:ABC transporter permease [Marinobacter sp. 2_MG-2023]MDO6441319.1 ABC transporter permease [Marinobacter sp. 2_MG-2023]